MKDLIERSEKSLKSVDVQIQKEVEEMCVDLSNQVENKGRKILMKISNNNLGMFDEIWTSDQNVNELFDFYQLEFKQNMVFRDYFVLPTNLVVIESIQGTKIEWTKLKKPDNQPLGEVMRKEER